MPVDLAVVVADGRQPSRDALDTAWPAWDAGRGWVVAADGGAKAAAALGLTVDVLVGDMDSVGPDLLMALNARGVSIERWPRDKDATDSELALRAALRQRPTRIVIVGASGGARPDHALANVALLGLADLAGVDVTMVDETSRLRLLIGPAEADLVGRAGDIVSLLPVGPAAEGISTQGLAFPLVDEPLESGSTRGVSNVRTTTRAHVSVAVGRLLIVEVMPSEEVQS